MTTYAGTKAKAGAQARFVHAGSIDVLTKFDLAETLSAGGCSAGDVIQMVKVPHGAIIDDLKVIMTGSGNDTKMEITIGDGGSATRFLGSASTSFTVGHTLVLTDNWGYQYNVSDDAADQYDTIDITIGTIVSATATGTITMLVTYSCDEADPA
jgi:hypothetical protein